ncbi:hypothetical protein SK571_19445 [Lentzea sp. BCCO 10_0798]|uniref:Uncharacterized protein n=1 Tax=Lentzea kristufekii TaxID=3095430 RepID=A0ABU4TU31_9PSEU|nr:hypothetical protein [Lentzea sp. BCCO 10_0798]MDX8051568.1 hypothetical protein [Lentzea sp. BCCO 10_0798]
MDVAGHAEVRAGCDAWPAAIASIAAAAGIHCHGGNLHLPVGLGPGIELDPAAVTALTRR